MSSRTADRNLRASVAIKQRRSLDELLPISASFALERVVRLTQGFLLVLEQLPQRFDGEVTFGIFLFIHNAR